MTMKVKVHAGRRKEIKEREKRRMEGGERLEEEREEARKVKMHAAHYIYSVCVHRLHADDANIYTTHCNPPCLRVFDCCSVACQRQV